MRTTQRLLAPLSTGWLAFASLLTACLDAAPPPAGEEQQALYKTIRLIDLAGAEAVTAVRSLLGQTYLETPTGLWSTDGTMTGTRLVQQGSIKTLAVLGNSLFYADASALWKTGTTGAPVKVMDLPGLPTAGAEIGAISAQRFAFLAPGADQSLHLWVSNGTAAGTQLVTSVVNPAALTGVYSLAFFSGQDPLAPDDGKELWASDGTVAGTRLVKDLNATGSSNPHGFIAWAAVELDPDRANVLFAASGDGTGTELWKSDGTSAGTVQLGDINPGTESSAPQDLALVSGDSAVFSAISGSSGGKRSLWATDFTSQGTALIHEVEPTGQMTPWNGGAFFAGSDPNTGVELWRTDGTRAGTSLVNDLAPGRLSTTLTGLLTMPTPAQLVFTAQHPTTGGPELMMLSPGIDTAVKLTTLPVTSAAKPPRAIATHKQIVLVLGGGTLWGVDLSALVPPAPPRPDYDPDADASCSAGRGLRGTVALTALGLLLLRRRRRGQPS